MPKCGGRSDCFVKGGPNQEYRDLERARAGALQQSSSGGRHPEETAILAALGKLAGGSVAAGRVKKELLNIFARARGEQEPRLSASEQLACDGCKRKSGTHLFLCEKEGRQFKTIFDKTICADVRKCLCAYSAGQRLLLQEL
jgi:hypothetical protein